MSEVTSKVCSKCKIDKPLAEFSKHSSCKNGVRSQCKECISTYSKSYVKRPDVKERSKKSKETEAYKQWLKEYKELDSTKQREAEYREYYKESGMRAEVRKAYKESGRMDEVRAKHKATDRYKETTKAYYESESKKEADRRYNQSDRGRTKNNANRAKYRAAKLERTPKWLEAEDFEIMEWVYEVARERTEQYGVKFEVDHIIPLQGELVSGFHCPENLQVITASENASKKNKFEMEVA